MLAELQKRGDFAKFENMTRGKPHIATVDSVYNVVYSGEFLNLQDMWIDVTDFVTFEEAKEALRKGYYVTSYYQNEKVTYGGNRGSIDIEHILKGRWIIEEPEY